MYIPPAFDEPDPAVLLDFVEQHPLAALVSGAADGPFATHLPLVLHRDRGPHGTLEGHFARANPHHAHALAAPASLAIFGGPDAYVTPAWYPSKQRHGKVVPTWNYVAVHASGRLRFVDDAAFLMRHLEELTARHEGAREHPWAVGDAPAEFIAALLAAIVGFELEITRLEGKWKVSQNRPADDVAGVVEGLAASQRPRDREVAALVAARRRPHEG